MPAKTRKRKSLRALPKRLAGSDEHIPAAVAEAWKRGMVRTLPGKLERTQREMLAELDAIPPEKRVMVLASRRIGKTWLAAVLMLEHCLRSPDASIIYVASTAQGIKEALIPIMEELTADCPSVCAPVWHATDKAFRFPNGAIIRVVGVDAGNFKNVRGAKASLIIIDEASFCDRLEHVVRSVLGPMTLRQKNARTLMLSSAPDEPNHPVIEFIKDHRAQGTLIERTIHDRTADSDEEALRIRVELARAIEECGGEDTPAFRREYCNELVFDTSQTVIPEWSRKIAEGDGTTLGLVREVKRPDYFHAVVGYDPGYTHHSGVVFGYIDFHQGWLVIEDELDVVQHTSADLAPLIKAKEEELWGHRQPFQRIMDNSPDAQAQMLKAGVRFTGIGKKELRSQTNQLRVLIKAGRLIIHPCCKKTIAQLYAGTWAKTTTENAQLRFKEDKRYGHFDLLAALIYLNARARFDENPWPASGYQARGAPPPSLNTQSGWKQASNQVATLAAAFKSSAYGQ